MKFTHLIIVLFLFSFLSLAQEETFPCATDQINSKLYHQNPDLQSGIKKATLELESFTQTYTQQAAHQRSGGIYIIPVVFHVIHDYGEGNISVAQINDAVKQVNLQFRKNNADTVDIVNDFQGLAADTEIEIRLAQLDPNGNCTNGITRTYSPLTNVGDHQVKSLVQWPPDQYLNVYVCNSAAGLAGHALLPGAADTIPQWDGIVMQHSYIGSIGTSNHFKRTVLTHEIGHFLNLQHIWGGNNVPDFYYLPVADNGNCSHDDGVADTPNTIGWQSCNLTGNTCSSLDMVQNYMDYSYCSLFFTEGQKIRMHAALNANIANRNNLWTPSNLVATGVTNNTNLLCRTQIFANKRVICAGDSVTFSDFSYHGVNNRNWTFEGGNINTSADSSVTVIYNSPGNFNVTLQVSNGIEQVDSVYTNFIQVLDNQPMNKNLIENFEDSSLISERWVENSNENPVKFRRINYGKNSQYSIYLNNYNGPERTSYIFKSKPIDATTYNKIALTFDLAYAKRANMGNERLEIQLSKDCGESWATRKVVLLNSSSFETAEYEYFPSDNAAWGEHEYTIPLSNYNVDNLMFRFKYNADGGNNLFLDNINFSDISELDLKAEENQKKLEIYPNPTDSYFIISSGNTTLNGQIILYDIYGNVIKNKPVKKAYNVQFSIQDIPSGTYFIRYESNQEGLSTKMKKVVILK
ncbi:M43 family zinc metalloprotease [Brumimicrobium salinarum]|nr:M43 family zinc metalloprotease [Brumimicrobium salinarum]